MIRISGNNLLRSTKVTLMTNNFSNQPTMSTQPIRRKNQDIWASPDRGAGHTVRDGRNGAEDGDLRRIEAWRYICRIMQPKAS